ncbi:hypothetical protein OIU79_007176 [Salix purpurea]|uniref:Uncharacterized protein n=1 Tax=Salix purpurea TaxID=77065 RepID=A0A9Q0TX76_SALPP|nr:hypothetical protein OIU79_007176 [Salix purpurea]
MSSDNTCQGTCSKEIRRLILHACIGS